MCVARPMRGGMLCMRLEWPVTATPLERSTTLKSGCFFQRVSDGWDTFGLGTRAVVQFMKEGKRRVSNRSRRRRQPCIFGVIQVQ